MNGKRTKDQSTSTKRSDSNEPLLNIIRAYAHELPSSAEHAEVGFVTPLSVLLSGGEELVCLFRELLCYRSEANLTLEVVLELIPLRLFGVERERVLAFCLEFRIIAPEVPSVRLCRLSAREARLSHSAWLPRA